jgi:hypothetical protein
MSRPRRKRPVGWKPHFDARLRRYFSFPDNLDDGQLAELFDEQFTPEQIKYARKQLGLARFHQHRWTPAEEARLRELAHTMPWREVAAAMGLSLTTIWPRACKLKLTKGLKGPIYKQLGLTAFLKEEHAAGWCDTEIAAEWNRRHPQVPISRSCISERRRNLGLPDNLLHQRRRRRVANKTREQLRNAGLKSLAEVRAKAFADFAAKQGWTGFKLRPRAVQVLNVLYDRGPHTRRQICEVLGLRWKSARHNGLSANGGRKHPDRRGTYLSELVEAGLVVRLDRAVRTGRPGGNVSLYAVAPDVKRKPLCPNEKPSRLPPSKASCSPRSKRTRASSARRSTTASRSPMSLT